MSDTKEHLNSVEIANPDDKQIQENDASKFISKILEIPTLESVVEIANGVHGSLRQKSFIYSTGSNLVNTALHVSNVVYDKLPVHRPVKAVDNIATNLLQKTIDKYPKIMEPMTPEQLISNGTNTVNKAVETTKAVVTYPARRSLQLSANGIIFAIDIADKIAPVKSIISKYANTQSNGEPITNNNNQIALLGNDAGYIQLTPADLQKLVWNILTHAGDTIGQIAAKTDEILDSEFFNKQKAANKRKGWIVWFFHLTPYPTVIQFVRTRTKKILIRSPKSTENNISNAIDAKNDSIRENNHGGNQNEQGDSRKPELIRENSSPGKKSPKDQSGRKSNEPSADSTDSTTDHDDTISEDAQDAENYNDSGTDEKTLESEGEIGQQPIKQSKDNTHHSSPTISDSSIIGSFELGSELTESFDREFNINKEKTAENRHPKSKYQKYRGKYSRK